MVPRILIIDDEADIREVTALSLETVAGWQVIQAPSGAQGVRRASLEQPDAILLDVMMPDIDGPTTFQILKQNSNTAHIPVLLLTAKVQGQDRRKLDALGASAILAKPFDPLTLAADIAKVLGWQDGFIPKNGSPDRIRLAGD
jgi:CheY-like chemotaxis protein